DWSSDVCSSDLLALQAALECLEFTLRLQIMRCISPGIPAPKQRLALLDGRGAVEIQNVEPGLRTQAQEFPHLIALGSEARALIGAKPVNHQDVIGMPIV